MKLPVLFETAQQNKYLHNPYLKKSLLSHPLVYYFINCTQKGIDVNQLLNKSIKIKGIGTFSSKDVNYYYKKYLLYFESGIVQDIDTNKIINERLIPIQIEALFVNTQNIVFEVTESCNLKCDYCAYGKYYENNSERLNNKINIKTALNVLEYIINSPLRKKELSRLHIGFYGGEPLMNFEFINTVVNYVNEHKELKHIVNFGMTTNGTLLNKYIDFLSISDFNIMISLDGNKENNDYRLFPDGSSAFDTIIKNINYVKEQYPDYFDKKIMFNAVLHNKNSVEEIYSFIQTTFGKIPILSELNTDGINDEFKDEFWNKYKNMSESFSDISHCSNIQTDLFIQNPTQKTLFNIVQHNGGFVFEDYYKLLKNNHIKTGFPTATCLPFTNKIFLTAKGGIMPCEHINPHFILDYVDENNSVPDFSKIAKTYNSYFDKLSNNCCNSCELIFNCFHCMFELNIKDNKPKCRSLGKSKKYAEYLSKQFDKLENSPDLYVKIIEEIEGD